MHWCQPGECHKVRRGIHSYLQVDKHVQLQLPDLNQPTRHLTLTAAAMFTLLLLCPHCSCCVHTAAAVLRCCCCVALLMLCCAAHALKTLEKTPQSALSLSGPHFLTSVVERLFPIVQIVFHTCKHPRAFVATELENNTASTVLDPGELVVIPLRIVR